MKAKRCQPQRLSRSQYASMKLIAAMALLSLAGFSCQKKYLGPEDIPYGTLFQHLQRMVISNGSGVTTHTFTYDAGGLLATHTILFKGKNNSGSTNAVEQYFRSSGGNVDSIQVTKSVNGVLSAVKKFYFYYGSGSNVDYSVIIGNVNDPNSTRDSSIYQYTGSFLIERKDYTTTGSAAYSSTASRDLVFQYSGSNISNLIFNHTTTAPITTLVSYGYDTAKAALPVNGFQYGYDSVCFANHVYAAINNLSYVKYGEGSTTAGASYSYTYVTQGKPVKASLQETFTDGGVLESSIEFFYD